MSCALISSLASDPSGISAMRCCSEVISSRSVDAR
jgi:hypothetical protein